MRPVVYDAAVCGAGPAGSSCAWKLAEAGADCVIIDSREFPRPKTCAGALSHRTVSILTNRGPLDRNALEGLARDRHRTLSCWWGGELLREHTTDGPPITMVARSELDHELLKRAGRAGAEVVTGKAVIDVDGEGFTLESGERISAAFLVGADGAGSLVRRRLTGNPLSDPGIGIEAFVPDPPRMGDGLQIHFGMVDWGYGWIFPHGREACVGVGGTGHRFRHRMLSGSFEKLCRWVGAERHPRPRGALIPSRNVHRSLGSGNVFLAGDAAGLVDQITGEGVGHAVESGLLVAEAILRGGDRRWLRKKARRGCLRYVLQSRIFAGLLYHKRLQPKAMRRLSEDGKFMAGFWELLSGGTTYCRMILGFIRG